jgi:hypothetical protein
MKDMLKIFANITLAALMGWLVYIHYLMLIGD